MEKLKKPFIEAIKSGSSAEVASLLKKYPLLVEEQTDEGLSLLLLSIYYRQKEITDLILNYKKHLTVFEAAASGQIEMLKKAIADNPGVINHHASDGFTLLGLACFFGHEGIAEFLISAGADVNLPANNSLQVYPLHSAVAAKNISIARLLLQHGADVNAKQMSGITPLHSAAHNGQTAMVELLLANNADKNSRTEEGKSPADMAEEAGFKEISESIGS